MYTIGFIGSDLRELSQLYMDFVRNTTESGVQRDQDHPPAVVCGVPMGTEEQSINAYKLLYTLGAKKIIITSDKLTEKEIEDIKNKLGDNGIKISSYITNYENLKKPSDSRLAEAKEFFTSSPENSNRSSVSSAESPDLFSTTFHVKEPLAKTDNFTIYENSSSNLSEAREFCLSDKHDSHKKHNGFCYLGERENWDKKEAGKNLLKIASNFDPEKLVGVIGGAGVMTGADFCIELSRKNVNFIMLSNTTAPDKNNALTVGGEDFAPIYLANIKLLRSFTGKIAIPCNTAHIKVEEFAGGFLAERDNFYARLIHIGDATLANVKKLYPNHKKVIILATPATTTHPKSAYNQERLRKYDIELIKPSDEQLKQIYYAIYEIKGFRSETIIDTHRSGEDISSIEIPNITFSKLTERAKGRILQVISEIREDIESAKSKTESKDYQGKIPVILGCTELPFVFTPKEMSMNAMISSGGALAELCSEVMHKDYRKLTPSFQPSTAVISPRLDGTSQDMEGYFSSDGETLEEIRNFETLAKKYEITYSLSDKLRINFNSKQRVSRPEFHKDIEKFLQYFSIKDDDNIKLHFQNGKRLTINTQYRELSELSDGTDAPLKNLADWITFNNITETKKSSNSR